MFAFSFTEQIAKTLELALRNIEEIRDYLKIVRSHALVSLNFLKNLRVIRGEKLATGGYVSVVGETSRAVNLDIRLNRSGCESAVM